VVGIKLRMKKNGNLRNYLEETVKFLSSTIDSAE